MLSKYQSGRTFSALSCTHGVTEPESVLACHGGEKVEAKEIKDAPEQGIDQKHLHSHTPRRPSKG